MESSRYTTIARLLHWTIALMVVGQFWLGWWMQSIPKTPPGPRAEAFNLHKSIGLTILGLMAFRILWRARVRPPPWPPTAPWKEALAKANHALLYGILVALPVSGYLGSVFSGFPVRFFGFTLPAWGMALPAVKDLMGLVHLGVTWALAAGFALHLAGAIHQAITTDDGPLGRMGWRRS
ncbi:MAG: cytochrome b [Usitatibacter sp.]